MAYTKRLEVSFQRGRRAVRPVATVKDIVDIVRHAMEALQPDPQYPANDKQLVFDELASVLDFFAGNYH